jgi:hypothetical protein
MQIITDANPSTRTPTRSACGGLGAVLRANNGRCATDAGEFAGCQIAQRRATRSSAWLAAPLKAKTRTQLQVLNRALVPAEAL